MSIRREVRCPICGITRIIEVAPVRAQRMCQSCAQHARQMTTRCLPLSVIVRRLAEAVAVAQHIAATRSTGGLLAPLRREVDELESALAALADDLTTQQLQAHVAAKGGA